MKKTIYTDKAQKLQQALSDARKQLGLTQAELAAKLGKPQSLVSYYENGGRRLDVLEYLEICETLGIDPAKMLRRIDGTSSRNVPADLTYIDETDIIKYPEALREFHTRQYGFTYFTADTVKRMFGLGKGFYVGLAEQHKNQTGKLPFLIRAHAGIWILNKKEYQAVLNGTKTVASLTPWQPGDGDAYAFVVFAISQVVNGTAFLLANLLAGLPSHPAYEKLQEIFWMTGNPKGEALSKLVGAKQIEGKHFPFELPDGKIVKVPFYSLPCKNGLTDLGDMTEMLGAAKLAREASKLKSPKK